MVFRTDVFVIGVAWPFTLVTAFNLPGMLQKQHPDIALSIKTRQAIRSVLNNLRDGIHELLLDGILDESEGQKLEHVKLLFDHICIYCFQSIWPCIQLIT